MESLLKRSLIHLPQCLFSMLPLLDKYTVWQVIKALEQDLTHLSIFSPSSLVTVALRNLGKRRKRNYLKFNVITIMQKRHPETEGTGQRNITFFLHLPLRFFFFLWVFCFGFSIIESVQSKPLPKVLVQCNMWNILSGLHIFSGLNIPVIQVTYKTAWW